MAFLTNVFRSRGGQHLRTNVIQPAGAFITTEAGGGVILLAAALLALVWANSPWDGSYFDLIHAHLSADFGPVSIDDSFGHLVNDGLMTVFFFVVGLEIKRELLTGELSSPRKAALPVAAALGGMIVPALLFAAWNAGGEGAHGWGIPMATDIAFALGVLALLGRRAPFSLKVFLLALAIVDDLGAILVIATFYTSSISFEALAWAAVLLVVIVAVARAGVRSTNVYVLLGALFWLAFYKTGIHATLAGVILAMLTPWQPRYGKDALKAGALDLVGKYRQASDRGNTGEARRVIAEFESLSRGAESPLDRLERTLHPWVSYGIVPLFALVNAGVALSGGLFSDAAASEISQGIAIGLVIGKPVGIVLACFITVRLGLADLPSNVNFGHLAGLGLVAGIGFTVSLFVTNLAFESAALVDQARLGVLAASAFAGVVGFAYLWFAPGEPAAAEATEPLLAAAK